MNDLVCLYKNNADFKSLMRDKS